MAENSPKDFYIEKGPKIWKEPHNRLVDKVFEVQPLAGSGLVRNDSKQGRLLSVVAAGGKGSKASTIPFQLIDASTATQKKIRVIYGYVRDVLNNQDWVPTGMSPGDNPTYVQDVGDDGSLYLVLTTDLDPDTGLATITSLTISETLGTEDEENTNFTLGTFSTDGDGGFHVQGASGNQGYMYVDAHFFWVY